VADSFIQRWGKYLNPKTIQRARRHRTLISGAQGVSERILDISTEEQHRFRMTAFMSNGLAAPSIQRPANSHCAS
jgi:hypothetical protein